MFSAAADGFVGCGAMIESSRFHEGVVICGRFSVFHEKPRRIETVGRADLSEQEELLERLDAATSGSHGFLCRVSICWSKVSRRRGWRGII